MATAFIFRNSARESDAQDGEDLYGEAFEDQVSKGIDRQYPASLLAVFPERQRRSARWVYSSSTAGRGEIGTHA